MCIQMSRWGYQPRISLWITTLITTMTRISSSIILSSISSSWWTSGRVGKRGEATQISLIMSTDNYQQTIRLKIKTRISNHWLMLTSSSIHSVISLWGSSSKCMVTQNQLVGVGVQQSKPCNFTHKRQVVMSNKVTVISYSHNQGSLTT
jgi:hypothetical protein